MYFNPSDTILVGVITLSVLTVGIIFAVVTIGGTRAITKLTDIARNYALADLALRREQAARQIVYNDIQKILSALAQIVLDVTGETCSLLDAQSEPGRSITITATGADGGQYTFVPNIEAFDKERPGYRRREIKTHEISGLTSNIFVVQDLAAIAKFLKIDLLPNTEKWWLIIKAPRSLVVKK